MNDILKKAQNYANNRHSDIIRVAVRRIKTQPCILGQALYEAHQLTEDLQRLYRKRNDWWNDIDPATNDLLLYDIPCAIDGLDNIEHHIKLCQRSKQEQILKIVQIYKKGYQFCKRCNPCAHCSEEYLHSLLTPPKTALDAYCIN